jgi:hypothetical protein
VPVTHGVEAGELALCSLHVRHVQVPPWSVEPAFTPGDQQPLDHERNVRAELPNASPHPL